MAITNPTPPPAIAFSKNMLNVVLQSDDYLLAAKKKSINFLQFESAIADADERPLSWNAGSAFMVAATTPDDSGTQFPTGDGGDAYVTSLVAWFSANYFINRDFSVSVDTGGVHPMLVFIANTYSPDYDFTDDIGGLAGVTQAGVTDQPRSNFAHHLELYIGQDWNGNSYDKALDANTPLDYPLTSKSTIDAHDELHAFIDSDYPELINPYSVCLASIRPWYFKYAEYYGDIPFIRKITQSDIYYINKGGLSKQAALLRDIVSELCPDSEDPSQNRFLRQGSKNKLVTADQPEWLTFINFGTETRTLVPEVVIYYSDTTSTTFNIVDSIDILAKQKVQFQTGYTQLDIASQQPDKTPVYYTVQMIEGDAAATDVYAYVIDGTYYEFPRYFVYENSYGAFQTIATVGQGQTEATRTKDDSQMAVDVRTAAIAGEFLETSVLIQEKGTIAIGYRRSGKRNVALLRDFLVSRKIYLYQNGNLIPIGLLNEGIRDYPDGANVDAEQIEYYPLYQEEVWSEPQPQADDTIADLLVFVNSLIDIGAVEGDYFYVGAGDEGIGVDEDGNWMFTDPESRITGRTGYMVYASQEPAPILPPNLTYNPIAGSFTILIPEFAVVEGYPLIVFTKNIDVL